MRLALITSHPIQYYAPLFRNLARQVDLTVFYAHQASAVDQARGGFGVKFDWDVDLLSGYDHIFLKNEARYPGVSRFFGCDTPEIYDRIAKGSFHAVLVTGWHLKVFWQAIFAAKRNQIPVFARGDSHLGTPRSLFKKLLKEATYPLFLRLFDGGLYVGERSREYWRHYRYPQNRLFFSPHCIDTEWFAARANWNAGRSLRSQLGIPQNSRVIMFAGKLIPLKRPLDIVLAVSQLDHHDDAVVVLVAGSGPLENEMLSSANALGVKIHCLGFRNQTEMPAVYSASDVLVLPSEQETWGLVANEALACGIPIVVSDVVGCAPDLAVDRIAGRIFTMGDPTNLAEVLNEILANPPKRNEIVVKCRAFSIDAAIEGILEALTASGLHYEMKVPFANGAYK